MPSRNLILHNFWWKAVSLLLAILVWVMLNSLIQTDVRREEALKSVETANSRWIEEVPITLLLPPSSTNRFIVTPETVAVNVGADNSKLLGDLQTRQVEAFVDVRDVEDQKQVKKPVQIHVPAELSVLATSTNSVTVERINISR
jgi:hypothetical protein